MNNTPQSSKDCKICQGDNPSLCSAVHPDQIVQSSKLDEILDTLWATAYNRGLDHAQQIYYSINDNDKIKHKSKSQILALIEEVIGEVDANSYQSDDIKHAMKALRKEFEAL